MDNVKQMEVALAAAIAAGHVLMDAYGEPIDFRSKESIRDVVCAVDVASEDAAVDAILQRSPNARVLSEERGVTGGADAEEFWVVDALDGTVNYVHEVPLFGISIAYFSAGQVQASCVYLPLADDLYYAARGHGAFKNQKMIRVRDLPIQQSLFAASFSGKSYDPDRRAEEYLAFGRVNDASCGCLRTGSAALNLAYLAEGRLNGCWGKANKLWDIAGGLLLAEEAGAKVDAELLGSGVEARMNYIAAPESVFGFLHGQVAACF